MLRKMKRAIARKRMINAGWVRLNHKDGDKRSKFAKNWRDFV